MPQENTISSIFAERLNTLLAGLPHGQQKELAEAVGVSVSYLNNVLKGRRGTSEDIRRKICTAMGVDYEELIFGSTTATSEIKPAEHELREFIQVYRAHGTPAFLRSCTEKLHKIREIVEEDEP